MEVDTTALLADMRVARWRINPTTAVANGYQELVMEVIVNRDH